MAPDSQYQHSFLRLASLQAFSLRFLLTVALLVAGGVFVASAYMPRDAVAMKKFSNHTKSPNHQTGKSSSIPSSKPLHAKSLFSFSSEDLVQNDFQSPLKDFHPMPEDGRPLSVTKKPLNLHEFLVQEGFTPFWKVEEPILKSKVQNSVMNPEVGEWYYIPSNKMVHEVLGWQAQREQEIKSIDELLSQGSFTTKSLDEKIGQARSNDKKVIDQMADQALDYNAAVQLLEKDSHFLSSGRASELIKHFKNQVEEEHGLEESAIKFDEIMKLEKEKLRNKRLQAKRESLLANSLELGEDTNGDKSSTENSPKPLKQQVEELQKDVLNPKNANQLIPQILAAAKKEQRERLKHLRLHIVIPLLVTGGIATVIALKRCELGYGSPTCELRNLPEGTKPLPVPPIVGQTP